MFDVIEKQNRGLPNPRRLGCYSPTKNVVGWAFDHLLKGRLYFKKYGVIWWPITNSKKHGSCAIYFCWIVFV